MTVLHSANATAGRRFHFGNRTKAISFKSSLILFGLLVFSAVHAPFAASESARTLETSFAPVEVAQLSPGRVAILEGTTDESIEGSKLYFTENKLKQAGFILSETDSVGTIIDNVDGHGTYGVGEYVFIDLGKEHGIAKGDKFTVFSRGRHIRHPVLYGEEKEGIPDYERPLAEPHKTFFSRVGRFVGYMVRELGILEVVEVTDGASKAIVKESYQPLHDGALITPFVKLNAPPRLPKAKAGEPRQEGYVIAFRRESYQAGLNDIVYIDRGLKDNVRPGDRFEFYKVPTVEEADWNELQPRVQPLIPQVIGEMQVLKVQEETATGVITNSQNPIKLGQHIRYKPVDIVPKPLDQVASLQAAPDYTPRVMEIIQEEEPVVETVAEESPFSDFTDPLAEPVEEAKLLDYIPSPDMANVHFEFDQHAIDSHAETTLQKHAAYLKDHPYVKVQIEGHADDRGTNNYNLALGERRAEAVRDYLISLGVEEDRMSVISYGEEKPTCFESSETCWQENRKVHFLVSEGQS